MREVIDDHEVREFKSKKFLVEKEQQDPADLVIRQNDMIID